MEIEGYGRLEHTPEGWRLETAGQIRLFADRSVLLAFLDREHGRLLARARAVDKARVLLESAEAWHNQALRKMRRRTETQQDASNRG